MLALSVQAPFAVFRTFTAGWYRPTATFLTPSAAYGLILNLAGIETRLREDEEGHPGGVPATVMRRKLGELPAVKLALGLPESAEFPRVATVFQQLHNYPVGKGNKVDDPDAPGTKVYQGDLAERRVKGAKSNIAPVRREVLVNLRALILLDGTPELEQSVRLGLRGDNTARRYGLPFLGDNSFLPDRIDPIEEVPAARWFERVTAESLELRPRTTRLTVWIDRADFSRTESALYAPTDTATREVPAGAWTDIIPRTTE